MLYNQTTDKGETLDTLKQLITEANYYIRGRFTSISGDFEDLEMYDFVKECYNITDAIERLERLIIEDEKKGK
jgi:hypothetical protein